MEREPESFWQKLDIVLKPVGGLLTALAVGGVGFFGSQYLEKRQSAETNVRLYADLMSRREVADTSLRQGMFETIIDKFLTADLSDPDQSVLAMELLAYNFHDALDLAPLFKDVNRNLLAQEKTDHLKRLRRVAREVTDKQLGALLDAGALLNGSLSFPTDGDSALRRVDKTDDAVIPETKVDFPEPDPDAERTDRTFKLEALRVDTDKTEVNVRLQVWRGDEELSEFDESFWVGSFDFPMIDNTRLINGQRCAVVLTNFGVGTADLSLIYFPGSRASLKEKPYYDEVIEALVRTRKILDESDDG